jgi:hypothetical protein
MTDGAAPFENLTTKSELGQMMELVQQQQRALLCPVKESLCGCRDVALLEIFLDKEHRFL